jgi:hypothetical protein
MRVLRLLPCVLMFSLPLLAQNRPVAQRDPQAVTVVQAAITALGGATAIGQHQSWTFQAQMQGPIDNGTASATIDPQATNPSVTINGRSVKTHFIVSSPFVPALMASVLLQLSQDSNYSLQYGGPVSIGSVNAIAVAFTDVTSSKLAHRWLFDPTTGLPTRVEIRFPIPMGQFKSFPGVVDLSDYRTVSGVVYPFQIAERIEGKPFLQTITLQSVVPNSTQTPTGAH